MVAVRSTFPLPRWPSQSGSPIDQWFQDSCYLSSTIATARVNPAEAFQLRLNVAGHHDVTILHVPEIKFDSVGKAPFQWHLIYGRRRFTPFFQHPVHGGMMAIGRVEMGAVMGGDPQKFDGAVRREGFWNQERLKLRESLALLVDCSMRRVGCDANGAFRTSFV